MVCVFLLPIVTTTRTCSHFAHAHKWLCYVFPSVSAVVMAYRRPIVGTQPKVCAVLEWINDLTQSELQPTGCVQKCFANYLSVKFHKSVNNYQTLAHPRVCIGFCVFVISARSKGIFTIKQVSLYCMWLESWMCVYVCACTLSCKINHFSRH